jgi:hypothetical protein
MFKKTQNIYYFIHINVTVFLIRGRRVRDRSWIYNYLCNQCLSPLTLSMQHYVITFVSETGLWFLRILRFPLPIKLTATIYLKFC